MTKITEYQILPISEADTHSNGAECWCQPELKSKNPPTWQHFTQAESRAKGMDDQPPVG